MISAILFICMIGCLLIGIYAIQESQRQALILNKDATVKHTALALVALFVAGIVAVAFVTS